MTPPSITVYIREGCPHCSEAQVLFSRLGLSPQIVDVADDESIARRYGSCVPIVVVDGRVRFRGRVSEVLLRRLLRNHLR
jgi:glutaredoxin